MKSKALGKSTSAVEVLNVSPAALWIYADGKEYALFYEDYPWFHKANIKELSNIHFLHGHHLYWPDLDVDLDIESLRCPNRFPLKAKS